MNIDVTQALLPAFVAGVAIQQLLEVVDGAFAGVIGPSYQQQKTVLLALLGMVFGVAVSFAANITVLDHLGVVVPRSGLFIDHLVAGFVAGSGSVGSNSILKFLTYSKEGSKAAAALAKATAARTPLAYIGPNALGLVDVLGARATMAPGRLSIVDRLRAKLRGLSTRNPAATDSTPATPAPTPAPGGSAPQTP